jgi:hypothetical protein
MAHALSITDGTTTFSLSSTNAYLQRYVPVEPTKDDVSVTETVDFTMYGASVSAMSTAFTTLGRLLDTMRRRRALGVGPVVYLQFQPDGDAATWRSQLLDARLEYTDDSLSAWPQAKQPVSLSLERQPFWEGALTQLPLTNANGTSNTSGLTVWNHDDSGTGHDNYVQIAAASVTGTLPAPVMVELTNATGSAQTYEAIYMATNAFCDPANFTHSLEAESIVVSGNYDSIGSNADSSNGQYVVKSITGTFSQYFDLSAALMADTVGHDFHLLARFRNAGTMYVRPSIWDASGAVQLRAGDEVEFVITTNQLVDLGVLPLPPGGYATTYGAQRLCLYYRPTGTISVQLDSFLLFPAASFRRLTPIGSVANGAKITDDPIEDRAYITTSSVDRPGVVRRSGPVQVWPNTLQRVYFAWGITAHTAPIDQTFTVKAWYRPRRLSF